MTDGFFPTSDAVTGAAMTTVAMSVRVPQVDAEFIASLDLPGASTPSDKLRAIIAAARPPSRN